MAKRIGITKSQLSKMELGNQAIPAELLKSWVPALLLEDFNELFLDNSTELSEADKLKRNMVKYFIMIQKMTTEFRAPAFTLIEDLYRLYLTTGARQSRPPNNTPNLI